MELSEFERGRLSPKDGFSNYRIRPIDIKGRSGSSKWWLTSSEQLVYPCVEGVSVSYEHGARIIGRCGKWSCFTCGELNKRRLLGELQHCRGVHGGLSVFSVLTFWHRDGVVKNPTTGRVLSTDTQYAYLRKWYAVAGKILGTTARCSIPEDHKDGSLHMNVVWFGVKRSFTSCDIKNRLSQRDMRLQCSVCDACKLRREWTKISGAERSTHEITRGDIARYVGKYLTKDILHQRYYGGDKKRKRYSFSKSVKRSHTVVPVYRYIGNELRSKGLWKWGTKKQKGHERRIDYLTDEDIFLRDESIFRSGGWADKDGYWSERMDCSDRHRGLCDRVPYWSPSKQVAWDGKHWEWFAKTYGSDTHDLIQHRLERGRKYLREELGIDYD